ncbi:universal stress protein [Adhaeribacter rhizoryzae]|uniref:Universal stress protein n=1 Tax=Adhaeribacter rhizoryzae TaxID=2607907 RepID=A0A5M6D638_9BACT|nr:universal stress protein [Adhaeribacter rhizoryzae]KAA5541279.1 universal stress protein [Adhaeribacter rhizoryzae]
MHTILVPVDYSLGSRRALTFAIDLARLSQASIVLLHAFHEPLSTGNAFRVDEAIAQLEKEKNQVLEEFAREVQSDTAKNFSLKFIRPQNVAPDLPANQPLTKSGNHVLVSDTIAAGKATVKINCVSKFSLAAEAILAAAANYKPDLIIMSMRGAGAVSQAVMGSTVSEVIQSARVPVLALPAVAPSKPIRNIVFASDLTHLPEAFSLRSLQQITGLFNAHLQVLHLYQDNNPKAEQTKVLKALELLDEQLHDLDFEVHFRQEADIATGIQQFAQEQQADLLALVPHRHTFLEILFRKSVTGQFTQKANLPLFILPDPNKSHTPEPLPVRKAVNN